MSPFFFREDALAMDCLTFRQIQRKGFLLWLGFFLFFLNLSSLAVPLKLSQLRVEGNQSVDGSLVLSTSGLEIGEELTTEKLREAIRKIYELNFFSEIRIKGEEFPEGINLVFVVVEKPTLERVEIEGNKKIKKNELEEKIALKPGGFVDPLLIQENKEKIVALYKEKGYLNATVKDIQSIHKEKMVLKLLIEEGKKVKVKKIEIVGNEALSDKKITKVMRIKAKRWFRSGDFKEELFKEDLDRILQLYKREGYLDAKIMGHEISYDPTSEWMVITIKVSEGERYKVGKIHWDGNLAFSLEKLQQQLKLEEGENFNQDKYGKSLENLYAAYAEEGYIYCQIEPEQEARGQTLDVYYRIVEGKPAHVRKIRIEGNMRTREKVIRRELTIKPGDLFKRSSVIRSQREVFNLGFFKDIKLDYEKANEEGDIDLIMTVEEKSTGTFQVGTAYNATDKLTGYIEISQPNLFGKGQIVNIRWAFGKRTNDIELGFTEPWLFDQPTSVGFDIFHTTRIREYYEEKRAGGSLRIGRPLPWLDYTRIYWRYTLEDVDFRVTEPDTSKVPLFIRREVGKRKTSSTQFTLIRDSRDNFFNASRGSRVSLSPEWAGGLLGGDVDFQKYVIEVSSYYKTFWKFVLMLRGRFGIIDGYTTPSTVPSYERFYLGGTGPDGVRGYPDRSIGPRELGINIGGRSMFITSLEYKFPIAESVYWLFFLEGGNAWPSLRESHFTQLKKGAGMGIRIEIPMLGIMGFDYGYRFDSVGPYAKGGFEPHFQMGGSF